MSGLLFLLMAQSQVSQGVSESWVLAGVSAVVAGLATAVAALYRGQIDALKERIDELNEERREAWATVAALAESETDEHAETSS